MDSFQHVLDAALFAAKKHAGQRRKGQAAEPYIDHLIEVAQLVSMAIPEPDTNLVIAALLHDTIEDTRVTATELIERFGQDVADLVVELTDDKSLPKAERRRLQIEHAPKMSAWAQTIKLAAKISNLRSILISPPARWVLERYLLPGDQWRERKRQGAIALCRTRTGVLVHSAFLPTARTPHPHGSDFALA